MAKHKVAKTCIRCKAAFDVPPSLAAQKYCSRNCYHSHVQETFADRFWAQTERSGQCLNWTGAIGAGGYGYTTTNRKSKRAHRVAYELTYGSVSSQTVIRHTCDNPLCCDVGHLTTGTQADNVRDKVERGRVARGRLVSKTKRLRDLDIINIRQNYSRGGITLKNIALDYGVHLTTISMIVNRKIWKHVH